MAKKYGIKEVSTLSNALLLTPEKFEEMISKSNGSRTVPQIFVNETHIGDCDYVHELDNKGQLDKILGIQ